MTEIKVKIPIELKTEMEKHPEINWSAIARGAFRRTLEDLRFFQEFTKDSEITEEDAAEYGRKVSEALAARYKE